MDKFILISIFSYFSYFVSAQPLEKPFQTSDRELGEFSGRVSRINDQAQLMRVRIDFSNMKYLNKEDAVEFWTQMNTKNRCKGIIKGKTNDYLLLRIPFFNRCVKSVYLTVGAYLHFYSDDLLKNIEMGKEAFDLMLKRHTALSARKNRFERELQTYPEKVDAVNKRYQTLREKLEKEWRESLMDLENDKSVTLREFKNLEIQLGELDYKLEKYRVRDENLKLDRWSLDHRLYYKK